MLFEPLSVKRHLTYGESDMVVENLWIQFRIYFFISYSAVLLSRGAVSNYFECLR